MNSQHEMTVQAGLELQAEKRPNQTALICETISVTYKELNQHVSALANWMLKNGAVKGDRALIIGKNKIELVEFILACSVIGLIAVPINTRLKENEIKHIIEETDPSFLYADQKPGNSFYNYVSHLKGELILELTDSSNSYEVVVSTNPTFVEKQNIQPQDPVFIIYTAAVDGYLKGAVLTQENVVACNMQTKELFELTNIDCCGIFTPLYHIAGTSLLCSGLHFGLTNVLLTEFNPSIAVKNIKDHSISIFCSFSPMAQLLLEESKNQNVKLQDYVRAIFGLDSQEIIQTFLDKGIDWYGIYAQTEVTGVIAAQKFSNPEQEVGLIGFPGSLTDIKICNNDGSEADVDEVGEICVKGRTVFSHYWNRPDDTNWTFRNGIMHTGDLASKDKSGKLWFKGRRSEKELIKTGGENVYPVEVERTIKLHPGVKDVVVFGVYDKKWLEMVKAVIEIKDSFSLDESEIKDFCKDKIASYKIPKIIEFIDEMPKKNGNIDRDLIKEKYG